MSAFSHRISQVRYFIGSVFSLSIVSGIIMLSYKKDDIHMTINSWNSSFFDFFFKYLTYVGDGVFVAIGVLVIGILGFKKYKWSPFIYGWGLLIISGALAQFFKRVVYSEALRPIAFLQDQQLHLIQGLEMHHHHSFPSGHTTAAFAFFGFIAIRYFSDKPRMQVLMALTAALIGYSRIYLSQHFLEDVLAGMLLGTFCLLVSLWLVPRNIARV